MSTQHPNRKRWRRIIAVSTFVLGTLGLTAAASLVVAPAAQAGPVYHAIDADRDPYNGIYLRNGTSMADVTRDGYHYILYGTAIELLCGTWGEAVGPYKNRRWHYVKVVSSGNVGWIADRYTDTPNKANEPTPGEAECSGGTPPSTGGVMKESWVGSSVDGIVDKGLPASPASVHHFLSGNPEHDFAFDTAAAAGTPVKVYVAPQNPGYTITTKVDRIGVVCGASSRGGSFITVGVYADGVRTGSVTYGHVNPTVSVGASVNRWGGQVGTISGGLPSDRNCWTGPHVHTELWTVKPYASCFNDYPHEWHIRPTNFIGFVGGTRATAIRTRCP